MIAKAGLRARSDFELSRRRGARPRPTKDVADGQTLATGGCHDLDQRSQRGRWIERVAAPRLLDKAVRILLDHEPLAHPSCADAGHCFDVRVMTRIALFDRKPG